MNRDCVVGDQFALFLICSLAILVVDGDFDGVAAVLSLDAPSQQRLMCGHVNSKVLDLFLEIDTVDITVGNLTDLNNNPISYLMTEILNLMEIVLNLQLTHLRIGHLPTLKLNNFLDSR